MTPPLAGLERAKCVQALNWSMPETKFKIQILGPAGGAALATAMGSYWRIAQHLED